MNSSEESKRRSYFLGLIAEITTIIYLFFCFYRVISWRHKTKFGEIDIIARRGRQIVFFEVKARKDKENTEVLSYNQQKRICDAAKIFLQKNKQYSGFNFRFDLIIYNPPLRLKHIKNAWECF